MVDSRFWAELRLKIFVVNNRGNNLPNLWGLCAIHLDPSILMTSSQHISISITQNNKISNICAVIGDFNVVLRANENRGTRLPARLPSEEFKTFLDNANLLHLPTRGSPFTWSNRMRGYALTEKRLDKTICNEDWLNNWDQISCFALPRSTFDHHPLILCSSISLSDSHSHFKFYKMWLNHSDCRRLVTEAWRTDFFGYHMFIFAQKMKHLKKELRFWNTNVFGNIHTRVKNVMISVGNIQHSIAEIGPEQDLMDLNDHAQFELLHALEVEEIFCKEKSRLN
ncbi:PREDICTED: uncharacterized protein LOC109344602 [Lupinus angustifolius]|uniref:uncharacterized protein LOC109344602 n=1 Tax=Lupinus angustifolius TaxID=3871 RepID=UPI00092EE806|nr:PREDICTED: uncharacterized protein LOC109344602 [Lupinus angustifolius]